MSVKTLLVVLVGSCQAAEPQEQAAPAPTPPLSQELVDALRKGPASSQLGEDGAAVPLVGDPLVPQVEVVVNGRGPYRMLVDLGSNVTLLRRDVVEAAEVQVLVERSSTDIARIDALRIGAALFTDVHVASYDVLDVQGVLGFNLLDDFPFTLDYPAKRLSFSHAGIEAPLGHGVLRYELIGRMPFLRVVIAGESLPFNLDTGASEWMTIPMAWKERFTWKNPPAGGPMTRNNQTGDTRVLTGVLAEPVLLGEHRFEGHPVYLNEDAEEAWFGSSYLKQFALTFDPERLLVRID